MDEFADSLRAEILEVIFRDIKARGPIFRALVSELSKEIDQGGPLTHSIRRAFEVFSKGQ